MLDNESSKYESKPWMRMPIGEIELIRIDWSGTGEFLPTLHSEIDHVINFTAKLV